MKCFNDLKFKSHPVGEGLMARLNFRNGYGVSVVRFSIDGICGSFTSNDEEWELAVLKDETVCYDSGVTEDVIGHLTADQVTDIMEKVQALSK